METDDAKRVVGEAILESGIGKDQHPRLLTDNGSCYISGEFKKFIDEVILGMYKELLITHKLKE